MDAEVVRPRRLERTEAVQLGYRLRRYLSGATDDELDQRLSDIAVNLYTVTSDGKIGVLETDDRNYWLEKLEHLIVECSVRGRDPLQKFQEMEFLFSKENLEKFRKQSDVLRIKTAPYHFYRFGDREHMKSLRDLGQILLTPASGYAKDSLDAARRDNEIVFRTNVCPHDYDLDVIDPVIKRVLPRRCYQHVDQEKPSNYFLFCVSVRFAIRLFADFKADACLIIRDQSEFEMRIKNAVKTLLPKWSIEFDQARYVDPYNMPRLLPGRGPEKFFFKHHRYMYQGEYRLVALPSTELVEPIVPTLLEIGSLADISELVTLSGHPFCSTKDSRLRDGFL